MKAFTPQQLPFRSCTSIRTELSRSAGYRDALTTSLGVRLLVAKVQDTIDQARWLTRSHGSRNRLQTVTLLHAITENGFDAAFGGARRDEDKARAKERILSFRDGFGQWDPRQQRPELWQLYQGKVNPGEHLRPFRCRTGRSWTSGSTSSASVCTASIYFAHERDVVLRDSMWLAVGPSSSPVQGETVERGWCAFAPWATPTVPARSIRGHYPGSDHRRDRHCQCLGTRSHPGRRPLLGTAMEDRKREGYF